MDNQGHYRWDEDNLSGSFDNQGWSPRHDGDSRRARSPPGDWRSNGDHPGGHSNTKRRDSEPEPDYNDAETPVEAFPDYDGRDSPRGDIPGHYRNGGDRYHRHDDSIELDLLEEGRRRSLRHLTSTDPDSSDWAHHLRHRRAKSQHVNGYDWFRQLQRQTSNPDHDEDNQSVQSLNFEDLKRTRDLLATIRVRRKSRKRQGSSKKSARGDEGGSGGGLFDDVDREEEDDEEYVEEVGLPSTRQRMKGLTERLVMARQMTSRSEVAQHFRSYMTQGQEVEGFNLYPIRIFRRFRSMTDSLSDLLYRINFWSQQFKEIEGHFGIATTTYFRFTRWLVKINFLVFFLFLCFIYIPQLTYNSIFKAHIEPYTNVSGEYVQKMLSCSSAYATHVENITEDSSWDLFLEIAQGTGFLENTMLFYGYYSNLTFWIPTNHGRILNSKYNMGLGYLLTVGFSFLVLFIMIVRNSSRTIKEAVMDFDHRAFPRYSNAVFGGWDFCINSEKMAFFKQKIIFNEFKATLEEVEAKRRRENRTTRQKSVLYLKRAVVSLIVLGFLAGSFAAIYLTVEFLLEMQQRNLSPFEHLMVGYLPSIVISILNVVVPEIFLALSKVEEYTHSFATHITIIRAVFLRLSSVWVLIVSLYLRLHAQSRSPYSCPEEKVYNATIEQCCGNTLWVSSIEDDQSGRGTVKCWESYVGQQFYKLGITDFISVTMVVFLIKIPRRIIHHHLKNKVWIVAKIGRAKFDLPLQVLDIVYSQTLCWTGMFFTPLLPAITFVKVFFFFFLKKFELLNVTESPENAYRASRSYSFFQTVLLISFIAISIFLGYMIGNLSPSMGCGPFRLYSNPDFVMFDVVTNEVNSWPELPKNIVKYFGTVAFFLPAFLILLLAIYYYWAIAAGYKRMEELLKMQLKYEAHDKQYLLARVDDIIKKGHLLPAQYH